MVNTNLVDSIRYYLEHGYTKQQVIDYLISFGYPPKEVNESYEYAAMPQPQEAQPAPQQPVPSKILEQKAPSVHSHKKFIFIVTVIVLIIGGSFSALAFWQFSKPVCGNGMAEKGETYETCCEDAGCLGQQECTPLGCKDPVCGQCQYLESHACKSYECCIDTDCPSGKECADHKCNEIDCGFCGFVQDHQCFTYECCSPSDCDAGEECAGHKCSAGCGACQYRSGEQCLDYECCENSGCAGTEECTNHECIPLVCGTGKIAKDHLCATAKECYNNSDCDDSLAITEDICIGAGTTEAHCVNIERGECERNSECDDGNITTKDICAGSPKKCSYEIVQCADIGVDCPASEGACNATLIEVQDTDYCCIGICTQKPDLRIDEMSRDGFTLEVEVDGIDDVNSSLTFKLFAFENRKIMKTVSGDTYYIIRGENTTDLYYFNFTIRNATINVTSVVDFDKQVSESNESNNNMTMQMNIPEE